MTIAHEAIKINSNLFFYMLSTLNGAVFYFFRFYTAIILFDFLPLSYYPGLMLLQGLLLSLANSHRWKSSLSRWQEGLTFAGLYACGLMIFLFCEFNEGLLEKQSLLAAGLFLLLSLSSQQLESKSSFLVSSRISLLKDPKVSTKISLFEEVGGTVVALGALWLLKFQGEGNILLIISALVSVLAFAVTWKLLNRSFQQTELVGLKESEGEQKFKKSESPLFLFPFVPSIITMFSIILCLKLLMGFGSFVGINQIKADMGQDLKAIFPYLSLAQTLLTFSVLCYSLFSQRIPNWNSGFKNYLFFQTGALIAMVIWPQAYLLVATDTIRKVFQRTFLAESNQLLKSNIPISVRHTISRLMDRWGNFAGFMVLGLISYLTFNHAMDARILWASSLVICVVGFFARKKLFERLSEYQIANLVNNNVYDVVHSCQSLAHRDARHYSSALISLLSRESEPFLLKSIIFSLSRMDARDSIPHLIRIYETNKREDVQLAVIKGLLRFKSHEVDYFLLSALQKIIEEQTALGEMRRSIFQAITKRLKDVSIPVLLGLLKKSPEDDRIIANVLIVMGEIAKERKDDDLFVVISQYLAGNYSRRVRVNALLFVYGNKRHYKRAFDCFSSLVTSKDEFDKGAVSFLAGELKLRGMIPFVLDRSEQFGHQNSTLLVALLKLGYQKAPLFLSQFINQQIPEKVQICINQLNGLEAKQRFVVYDTFLSLYPERIGHLVNLLVSSNRDFDEDIKAIWSESLRLGIEVEAQEVGEEKVLKIA